MTFVFHCGTCRQGQSVGANLVAAYRDHRGMRSLVCCPDCTSQMDAPCDEEMFRRLVSGVVGAALLRVELAELLARPDAADVIGGRP